MLLRLAFADFQKEIRISVFFLEPKKRQMWLKVWFSKLEEAENLNCGIFEVEEEDVDFVSSRFVLRTYYYILFIQFFFKLKPYGVRNTLQQAFYIKENKW